MPTTVFAYQTKIPQPNPPEGRHKYPLGQGAGGGDGVTFVTGNENFQWSTSQLPAAQQPSGIRGAWVDATAIAAAAGKNAVVTIGDQVFVVPSGSQGYIVCAVPGPKVQVNITAQGGMTGLVYVHLFNYNPLFTGSGGSSAPIASSSNSSGGGGTPGGGGSGSGGFLPTCFTPDTLVLSEFGVRPIRSLRVGDRVVTASGHLRKIKEVQIHDHRGLLYKLHSTAYVTGNHRIWVGRWARVEELGLVPIEYAGKVYNLETDAEESEPRILAEDTEHSFQLACGIFAHNNRPYK